MVEFAVFLISSTMRFKARAFALAFLFAIFKILYISHSEMHVRIL